MSNITHLFNVNVEATEHYIISTSPNLIITAESAPGEANSFMASKWGEYNHVKGFETGKDKIKIPLDTIKEVFPSTTLVKGTLPAAKYGDSADQIEALGDKLLYWVSGDEQYQLLTLDGNPTVVAADIEIL